MALLAWNMCSSSRVTILHGNTKVNEKEDWAGVTMPNQDVLWFDVAVNVIT